MATDLAELSSISSTLEQLLGRLGAMAEAARRAHEEDVASELFTVERGLAGAHRRLSRMVERAR
ncbi:MAG TPA: hypothetical protein VFN50_11815 [Acidimicrobiales bacterium]|nr:hypothetical protein [Acidimicrobiales bacterium]